MLEALGEGESKFGSSYDGGNGRMYTEYHLPKDLTITLVSGYRVDLRHRIVTRWLELEEQPKVQLPDFTKQAPTSELEEMARKADAYFALEN